jgi:type IV pilus assembly protein PilC
MSDLAVIGILVLAAYIILGFKRPGIAFTTAPVAAFILLYVAIETEAPEILVLAPMLFITTLTAVAASGLRSESRQWFHWWAWWLLLAIVAVLLIGAILAGIGFFVAGYVLPLLFVLGIVAFVASLAHYGVTSRRVAVMSVFTTLGASMRQNLPLPMALDCAASSHEGGVGFILRGIKTWLVKGYPLTEAIRRGYPQCPSRALAILSAGERIDQLGAALRAIETDLKASATERGRLQPVHPFYPVAVLTFAFVVVLALMTFVMPQFKTVLDETAGGKLPASTRLLMEIMSLLVSDPDWSLCLGLIVVIVGGIGLYRLSRRRRPQDPYPHTWVTDSLKWFLPVVHWFERNRSMVQVVEVLRMSLHAGCPVNEAIRGTLQLDVNVFFRTRLICWLRRVERGENIAESARRCGLGAALAWAFDGGADTGNTPAVLEMLESHYRSNYSYRVNLTRFILWPLGIIVLGATVGFIVYAVFSPTVAILSHLATEVYP